MFLTSNVDTGLLAADTDFLMFSCRYGPKGVNIA